MRIGGNEFNRSKVAGAFGDLGTLIPFVVGYVTINRLDPQGILLGFALLALATGLSFRTPMPVQPMKAIGTSAVTHPDVVTRGVIFVAAAVTGRLWLVMGATRTVSWLAALTSRPVVRGIVLGLGLSFILDALFFADSVATLFRLFLMPVLGVILFFGGIELAAGANGETFSRAERAVLVVTAGIAPWNMGVAYRACALPCEPARPRQPRLSGAPGCASARYGVLKG